MRHLVTLVDQLRERNFGFRSVGFACWPGKQATSAALCGMATYGLLVTLYLSFLGIRGEWVGPLLWPAVALHAVLTLLLVRTWFS
jgi:hypothetical protein